MPYPLCRHIMSTGHHCQSPSLKGQNFCYHHNRQRRLTARPPRPNSVTIPFEFPDDRAAIQTNYQLAALAVLEGKLEPRQANSIIHAYRAAAVNLKAGPLTDPDPKNHVDRVILTPEGEEIAPAREGLMPDEELTHGPECPCAYCAETHRNAPGELHHPDCQCGLCDATEEPEQPAVSNTTTTQEGCHSERSEEPAIPLNPPQQPAEPKNNDFILSDEKKNCHSERAQRVEEPALSPAPPQNHPSPHPSTPEGCHSEQREESAFTVSQPPLPAEPKNNDVILSEVEKNCHSERSAEHAAEEPAVSPTQPQPNADTQPAPTVLPSINAAADRPAARKSTRAHIKLPAVVTVPPPITTRKKAANDNEEESEDSYQSVIRNYYKRLAERQAARAAGIEPPRPPRDPNKPQPEGLRRYRELMAQVERNKQLAEEAWHRFVATEAAAGRTVTDPLANRAVLTTNPDGTTTKRYLTWNEEEDRRQANWKRLLDNETAQPDTPQPSLSSPKGHIAM